MKGFSVKDVVRHLKAGKIYNLVYELNLALMVVIVFALGTYFTSSLYITIPFILIPWLYASMLMMIDEKANGVSSPSLFFSFFSAYYKPRGFGSFRLIKNFLISIGISILTSSIASTIYYVVAINANPEFSNSIYELMNYMSSFDVEALIEFSASNEPIARFSTFTSIVSIASFFIVFIHKISLFGLNSIVRTAIITDPRVSSNALFIHSLRSNRKEFYRHYNGMLYPLFILEIIGGVSGYFISGSIPSLLIEQRMIFAVGFACLLLAFAFPYYVSSISLLVPIFMNQTVSFFQKEGEEILKDEKTMALLSNEEKEDIKEGLEELNAQKREFEKSKEEMIVEDGKIKEEVVQNIIKDFKDLGFNDDKIIDIVNQNVQLGNMPIEMLEEVKKSLKKKDEPKE